MTKRRMLAIDIGAESGRAIEGTLENDGLTVAEVHRFANEPTSIGNGLYWDLPALFRSVRTCVARAGGSPLDSIALDAWGLDFVLIDPQGELVTLPRTYRDPRTDGIVEAVADILPGVDPYGDTGIQTMQVNTLYQLWAMRARSPWSIDAAARLLMIPDILAYWLTGVASNELTIASTTQLVSAVSRDWAWPLIDRLGFPARMFHELVEPGTSVGHLDGDPGSTAVVASASHDTAAAVAGAAAVTSETAFISSGSWCLVGAEVPRPILSDAARAANLSNELGVGGRTRLLKNVMGLWLLAESRRYWQAQGLELTFEAMVESAGRQPSLVHVFDPDDATLLAPGDVPVRISRLCGADAELEHATITRAIIDSLALKFRSVIDGVERAIGRDLTRINLVGGGARNRPLCQATANACGRPVIAGPEEATSIGNLIAQLIGHGDVGSIDEGRGLVARTAALSEYEPTEQAAWEEAYQAFRARLAGAAA